MTTDEGKPIDLAGEVTKRVLEALKPEFEQLRGEVRSAKRELGEEIDAINARATADKASLDEQLNSVRQEISGLRQDQNGIRQDISRLATTSKAQLDSHTARLRSLAEKANYIEELVRAVIDRLDRANVPAE